MRTRGSRNGRCEGPERGACSLCLRNSKESGRLTQRAPGEKSARRDRRGELAGKEGAFRGSIALRKDFGLAERAGSHWKGLRAAGT